MSQVYVEMCQSTGEINIIFIDAPLYALAYLTSVDTGDEAYVKHIECSYFEVLINFNMLIYYYHLISMGFLFSCTVIVGFTHKFEKR